LVLRGVRFDTAKATLRPESLPVLDEVVTILERHPNVLKVRIDGHTDSRGTAGYNRRLSDRRATTVRQYLISKGISKKRMSSRGFGEDKLLKKVETSEEDYFFNRRVEFVILKMAKPPTTPAK
jgi:OOP family OmpA-OmpF porin